MSALRAWRKGRPQQAHEQAEPQVLPPAIPLALAATLLHAAADTVPTLNIEPGCRAAAKMGCLATAETGGHPSYVEVLVCLQMGQDAAQLDEPSSGRN